MNTEKEKEKCVIYVRVSTEMQVDGYSLSAQKETLYEYAKRNDLLIVEEYEDAGKSGKSIEGRPAFKKMMADIGNGLKVNYVLVFKLSRFGRSAVDILSSIEFIRDYDVHLISVNEGINSSTPSGKLLISVLSAVAEIERENIQEQTMLGRREKARQGKWNGGFSPYGYSIQDGVLIQNEDEAKIVKFIFEMYASGKMSIRDIVRYLNINHPRFDRTLKAYTKWTESGIKYMLDNEVYEGLMPYGRYCKEKVKGTKNDYHRVNKENYLKEKGQHEGIVSEELFEQVRNKRQLNKSRYVKSKKHVYLLSDLIMCPTCYRSLLVHTIHYKNKDGEDYRSHSYACHYAIQKKHDQDKCSFKHKIPAEAIENVVIDIIDKLAYSDTLKDVVVKELNSTESVEELKIEIETYEAKYKDLTKKKNLLITEIDNLPTSDPRYVDKNKDLNRRLDAFYNDMYTIQDLKEKAQAKLNNITSRSINTENILGIIKGSGTLIKNIDPDNQKILLHKIIGGIELREDFKEGENPIKRIAFQFPLFNNQDEASEINWDKDNLPYIYQKLDGRNDVSIGVEVDDILGKIDFPIIHHERYKPKTRNRPMAVNSDNFIVDYIKQTHNLNIPRKYIMNVRHDIMGKKVKGYLPKGQKYLVIKEALERFGITPNKPINMIIAQDKTNIYAMDEPTNS